MFPTMGPLTEKIIVPSFDTGCVTFLKKAQSHLYNHFHLQCPPSIEAQVISGLSLPENLHLIVPLNEWGDVGTVEESSGVAKFTLGASVEGCLTAASLLTSSLPPYWVDGVMLGQVAGGTEARWQCLDTVQGSLMLLGLNRILLDL